MLGILAPYLELRQSPFRLLVQRHLPAITAQAHILDILAIDSSKVEVKNVVPSR
jgi:hypothetical protein